LTEKTVVIFSADHGDNLFEHGLEQKHCFYEGPVGVPLIVAVPDGVPRGVESPQLTSLIDVMPTVAALTGLPVPADADGMSLLPAMRGEIDPDRAVFSEFYEWDAWPGRMIRYREWKYILYRGHSEVLFNLDRDPHEMENLAGDPVYDGIRSELRRRVLNDWHVARSKE
jgi:choline-sulfatase